MNHLTIGQMENILAGDEKIYCNILAEAAASAFGNMQFDAFYDISLLMIKICD